MQGLTNPLSGSPGQVKIYAGQAKSFLTCPENCISHIGKTDVFLHFLIESIHRTSGSDFDLSGPEYVHILTYINFLPYPLEPLSDTS